MMHDQCTDSVQHSKVKVEEGVRSAVFINDERSVYHRTRFDGCVISNAIAADWVVSKPGVGDVIVELKGRGVDRGIKQVRATADWLKDNAAREGKLSGLIVCRQYPGESTTVQKEQLSFFRAYGSLLHVASGNREYIFESLLSRK